MTELKNKKKKNNFAAFYILKINIDKYNTISKWNSQISNEVTVLSEKN